MQDLEDLRVENNKFSFVSLDTVTKLTKINFIFLSWNQVEELSNCLLNYNINLKWIYVYGSKIKFFSILLFDGFPKLIYVDVKNNIFIDKNYQGIIKSKKDIEINCKETIEIQGFN